MADRIYDRKLDCGCMVSSDGGGGVMPCSYEDSDSAQSKLCAKSWAKFEKSEDYQLFLKEIKEKNE